jgi:hypothetical protein
MAPNKADLGRRVILHIGLPKTGTTYLQTLFAANRSALAEQGIYYPGEPGESSQHMAAWDLRGQRARGAKDIRQAGRWDALCTAVRSTPLPTTLISTETLSALTRRQAARAVNSFPDHDVQVVVTCRDVGRVLVSAWQQGIRAGHTSTWREFVAAVQDPAERGRHPARGFWMRFDLPAILTVWGTAQPAGGITVVTVPPAGAPPEQLLRRMAEVVGFDFRPLREPPRNDNASLGVGGTEVVRRLNIALGRRLNERQYTLVVGGVLAPALSRESTDYRYGLPEADMPWAEAEANRQMTAVRAGGYPVVGNLGDLLPRREADTRRPDDASDEEVLNAAMLALTTVTDWSARLWWAQRKDDQPQVAPAGVRVAATSAGRAVGFRTRRLVADLADRNKLVGRAIGAYLQRRGQR